MKKLMIVFVSIMFLAGCGSTIKDPDACSNGFHREDEICVEDKEIRDEGSFNSSADVLDLFNSFRERTSLVTRGWGGIFMMEDAAMDAETPEAGGDEGSDDYSEQITK